MITSRWFVSILLFGSAHVFAQEQRDPTRPPAETAASADGGAVAQSPLGESRGSVVVRDGKPYLVVGTRLVAVGQKVGQARLERVTETEIWLREDGVLQKLPRFVGVQRHASDSSECRIVSRTQDKGKRSTLPKPPVAPCEGTNP